MTYLTIDLTVNGIYKQKFLLARDVWAVCDQMLRDLLIKKELNLFSRTTEELATSQKSVMWQNMSNVHQVTTNPGKYNFSAS